VRPADAEGMMAAVPMVLVPAALVIALAGAVAACAPVRLRTQAVPISACDAALFSGRLVASPRSGLALTNPTGVSEVVWPFGYAARWEAAGIVLLDSAEPGASILAREGDLVEVGGGVDGSGVFVVCPASLRVVAPAGA
jgi:hypothetical protein